jgi:hypothetical protein
MSENSKLIGPYHGSTSTPSIAVLRVQQGEVGFNLRFPDIKKGVIHTINQYGKLYYGTTQSSLFKSQHFIAQKHHYISELRSLDDPNSENYFVNREKASFVLELCRELLKSKWRWPVLINRLPTGDIGLRTGLSRAIVNVMTLAQPWKHLPVLFYEKPGFDVDAILEDYVSIDNIEDLERVLNLADATSLESTRSLHPKVNIGLCYDKIDGIFWPILESISSSLDYDDKEEFGLLRSDQYLKEFLLWQSRYQSRPTLHIYTDWPEAISDTNLVWNVVHAGPSTPTIELIQGFGNRPAILEKPCLELHSNPLYTVDHTLYVIDDKKLDVGDFLPWMDLKHTTFIDEHWKFIMYRKDQVYKNTFIKIGRTE